MKSDNVVQSKSYAFAIKIVNVYRILVEEKKEYVLCKQLLKSGTSIGANIEEAIGGQSDKDFLSKMSISYKETRETIYWLRLLSDTGYLDKKAASELIGDAEELVKIVGAIQRTMKERINNS